MFAKSVLLLLSVHLSICTVLKLKNFDEVISVNDSVWWKTATVYQIYPLTFRDTNKDGVGDLPGIIQKLDYIKGLGVQAIWLSPIFASPFNDNGYDISDYRAIDPKFGTIDDFQKLILAAHKAGLKVIIDFVPNHTSNKHKWFNNSIASKSGYEDFYVWRNCTVDDKGVLKQAPNNWVRNTLKIIFMFSWKQKNIEKMLCF